MPLEEAFFMNLKLASFRVQNFRSIVDTDWQNLSVDNITGIIGQNESGKSSIIEALEDFYTNKISQDDIRSSEIYPRISCSFVCSNAFLQELDSNEQIKKEVKSFLKKSKRINLVREWENVQKSSIQLEENDLRALFNEESNPTLDVEVLDKEPSEEKPEDSKTENSEVTPEEESKIIFLKEKEFVDLIVSKLPAFELFEDFSSLLPNRIDLEDIQNQKTDIEGYKGAINLLTLAGLDLKFLTESHERTIAQRIKTTNTKITADFREYWSQKIGKTNKISLKIELKNYPDTDKKAGKPYLAFWVEDGQEMLYPKQRSQGVRWFLSFYLQLRASKIKSGSTADQGQVMLIDEPGMSLHAKAQEDVLKVFDDIKENITIIYTTHSPYLVRIENLYRLLAAQRKDEEDENSETEVMDIHKLGSASPDTLTPLYTSMGINLSDQNAIKKKGNVLLEEPSAYYYIQAFKNLVDVKEDLWFIPATSATKIPQLAYQFLGWGLDFSVVVDDDSAGKKVFSVLKETIYENNEDKTSKKVCKIVNCLGIEDVFSKTDFKKFVLADSAANVNVNSKYFEEKKISKIITAVKFKLKVEKEEIKLTDFTQETTKKIKRLMEDIKAFA